MSKDITKGSIVKFRNAWNNDQQGYYKVTNARGTWVNLGSIFGKSIYHKRVPVKLLEECEREWYSEWQKSETYQCM